MPDDITDRSASPPESREPKPGPLSADVSRLIGVCCIIVFVIAAIATVALVIVNAFDASKITASTSGLLNIVIRVGALALLIALISTLPRPFFAPFGILIVGAVIVPHDQLVAIYHMATGKEIPEAETENKPFLPVSYSAPPNDQATRIVFYLQHYDIVGMEGSGHAVLTESVACLIKLEQTRSYANQVRFSGTLTLFRALSDSDALAAHMVTAGEERNRAQFNNLRTAGLINFQAADHAQAQYTRLGRDVLQLLDGKEPKLHESCPYQVEDT